MWPFASSNMADDIANRWGCNLVHVDITRKGRHHSVEGNCFKRLEEVVRKTTKGDFLLAKVAACGSDANAFAALEAAKSDTSRICIAAGCYVAGDHSVLQNWSSSCFDVAGGLAEVQLPENVPSQFTQHHTVALPYRIPCKSCDTDASSVAEDYEDKCLNALHVRFLLAHLWAHPFNALILEFILGGNGASLSGRALNQTHHDFRASWHELCC